MVGIKSLRPIRQTAPWGHQIRGPRAELWAIGGEPEIIQLLQSLQPTGVCVDIGSWIGKYALLMSKTSKRVIAVEPDRHNFRFLQQNLKLNNVTNVDPIHAAVETQDGTATLRVSPSAAGHSLVGSITGYGYWVKTISLTTLFTGLDEIELIKMDIEGVEFRVLPHLGDQYFKRVKQWIVECHLTEGQK